MPILNSRAEGKTQAGEVIPAPEILANIGPVIPVTLTLPDDAQRACIERGEQPPAPVNGIAMIALLGRDILKSAILTCNGPDGHFSLAM